MKFDLLGWLHSTADRISRPFLICADGTAISVQHGEICACSHGDQITAVEVACCPAAELSAYDMGALRGFRPHQMQYKWHAYGYVPLDVVSDLIAQHGGVPKAA